jgi:hypothetical protein
MDDRYVWQFIVFPDAVGYSASVGDYIVSVSSHTNKDLLSSSSLMDTFTPFFSAEPLKPQNPPQPHQGRKKHYPFKGRIKFHLPFANIIRRFNVYG